MNNLVSKIATIVVALLSAHSAQADGFHLTSLVYADQSNDAIIIDQNSAVTFKKQLEGLYIEALTAAYVKRMRDVSASKLPLGSSVDDTNKFSVVWKGEPTVAYREWDLNTDWRRTMPERHLRRVEPIGGGTKYSADGKRSDPADAGDLLISLEGTSKVKSSGIIVGKAEGEPKYFARFDPADAGVLLEPMIAVRFDPTDAGGLLMPTLAAGVTNGA